MTYNRIAKKIYHTGINVSDMDRALHFYVDLLGCQIKLDIECKGEELDRGLNLDECCFRLVYLQIGSDEIELFQHRSGPKKSSADSSTSTIGIRHLGFVVHDIDESYRTLSQAGVHFLSEPIHNADGVKWVYLRDPDDYYVELVQLPKKN